jgi:hypothetical protein
VHVVVVLWFAFSFVQAGSAHLNFLFILKIREIKKFTCI